VYMIAIMLHSIVKLYVFARSVNSAVPLQKILFNWIIQIFIIMVVLVHSPVVFLQLKSQLGKLCRRNDQVKNPDLDETTTNNDYENDMMKSMGAEDDEEWVELKKSTKLLLSEQDPFDTPGNRSNLSVNLKEIFAFRPQTQEYLFRQLFGDETLQLQS